MKNKFKNIDFLFANLFYENSIFIEIEFNASNIEILNERELTIANDAEALIKADGVS